MILIYRAELPSEVEVSLMVCLWSCVETGKCVLPVGTPWSISKWQVCVSGLVIVGLTNFVDKMFCE